MSSGWPQPSVTEEKTLIGAVSEHVRDKSIQQDEQEQTRLGHLAHLLC